MKVLIALDGKHEEGLRDHPGALETIVFRLLDRSASAKIERSKRKDIHAFHGKGKGYAKKALRWMLEAQREGYEALVLVIDQDGFLDRTWQFDEAQEDSRAHIRRALGVAIRSFDAWMLADERALSRTLETNVERQKNPEDNRRPKEECKALLRASLIVMSQTEMYARVSRELDLAVLEESCPRGFAPFASRVRRLAE